MPRECVQCTSKHTVHIVNMAHAPWTDHALHEHAVHPMTVSWTELHAWGHQPWG